MASNEVSCDLKPRVDAARERLDAHVREIVAWHFDPETGCPFWLDFAAKLDKDARYVLFCDNGVQSGQFANVLQAVGYEAYALKEGTKAVRSGRVCSGRPPGLPG